QTELQFALGIGLRCVTLGFPAAAVPHYHLAGTIFAFWDGSLEFTVGQWVVFHLNGHAFDGWVKAWALGYGPTLECAVEFEPEIVVKPPRPMFLYDELRPDSTATAFTPSITAGLGCLVEITLAVIVTQGLIFLGLAVRALLSGGGRFGAHAAFRLEALLPEPDLLACDFLAAFFAATAFFAAPPVLLAAGVFTALAAVEDLLFLVADDFFAATVFDEVLAAVLAAGLPARLPLLASTSSFSVPSPCADPLPFA